MFTFLLYAPDADVIVCRSLLQAGHADATYAVSADSQPGKIPHHLLRISTYTYASRRYRLFAWIAMEVASALMLAACPEQQTPPPAVDASQGSSQAQLMQQPSNQEPSQELSTPDAITPAGQVDRQAAELASGQMDPVLLLQAFQLIKSANVWPAAISRGTNPNAASMDFRIDPQFTQGLDFILDIAVKVCHDCFPQPVTALQDAQPTQGKESTDKAAPSDAVSLCCKANAAEST